MHAFFFGSGQRRLFGIYEPSRRARSRPAAALLCHPWGAEYLHAHKSMRVLANMLAEAGVDTLRFDYYATGDSGGADGDGDLAGWRQDVLTAAEELTSLSGAQRITVIGMRLGGALAMTAASDLGKQVERVVLWDPVVNGAHYIDQLFEECRQQPIDIKEPVPRPASKGGGHEVLGFPLTARLGEELSRLSLADVAARVKCPVQTVISGREADVDRAQASLAQTPQLTIDRIEHTPVWSENWPRTTGVVPVEILNRIVGWVAA